MAEAYRAFRGKDPGIDALMRDRGFPVPPPTAPALSKEHPSGRPSGWLD